MYKALKQCKFDRKYGVGEVIPAEKVDAECLKRAISFGYVEVVEDERKETESPEEAKNEGEEVIEAQPEVKRRGRKKAVV